MKVAGIGYEDRLDVWDNAEGNEDVQINLCREPENEYDENAIVVYVDGFEGGYIPRKTAAQMAPLMDAGMLATVYDHEIERKEKKNGDDYVIVTLSIAVNKVEIPDE